MTEMLEMSTRLSASQRGAWGEAIAIAWLIERGYEVFLGLGNPSVDFLAMRGKEILRVEAKVGSRHASNGRPVVACVKPDNFDLLLVITEDGRVLENPTGEQVYGAP